MELNTTNPHCFTYQTEELLIEILGGVRVDGLGRMRVTIKVTVVNRKQKDNLSKEQIAQLADCTFIDRSENVRMPVKRNTCCSLPAGS